VPRSSSSLADKLGRRFRILESTRRRVETLARRGALSQQAALRMYESLYLSAHVSFESFLEDLFLGLLVSGKGVESGRKDVFPRVELRSYRIARDLITGPGKRYVDWIPFDRTIDLAQLFFRGGRPFSDLSAIHKETLSKSHIIRNAIAHRSHHSIRQFERKVIGATPLPPGERTPAGYLRGTFRVAPVQTRFSSMLAQMVLCARDLAR
jgi:hypothetical protein